MPKTALLRSELIPAKNQGAHARWSTCGATLIAFAVLGVGLEMWTAMKKPKKTISTRIVVNLFIVSLY